MDSTYTTTNPHPDLLRLLQILQHQRRFKDMPSGSGGDPRTCCDRVEDKLRRHAGEKGLKVGVVVRWGNWDLSEEAFEAAAMQFVIVLDVTAHVPSAIRPEFAIQINHKIHGHKDIPDYMADLAVRWGVSVIDRLAGVWALVINDIDDSLLEWMTGNLENGWNNHALLDPEPRNFIPFFDDDESRYNCSNIHCLKIDDEADRLLFRLRWF